MRKPGQPDTLVKIASLGGGGIAIGSNLQKTHDRDKKIKEEIEKAKREDTEYRDKIKRIKMKHAAKKLREAKDGKKDD